MLDLMSSLNFHPNRFYLPQYFVRILSLLLSSLKGVCPNKLLIDLFCPFSQPVVTGLVMSFLFFFFFFLRILKVACNLSFVLRCAVLALGTNALISLLYLWERQYSRMKGPISLADQCGCPGPRVNSHRCHRYVLFCTMSYLLIYSTPTTSHPPLTSYLAH